MRCLACLLALASCTGTVAAPRSEPSGGRKRVLFVGNSLTFTNDLPGMVQALADAAGAAPLAATMVAGPNLSLDDQLEAGVAARALAEGGWDVVVLQQGPSSLPESRAALRRATRAFEHAIRQAGARPALYAVWPAASRAGDFDRVSESYALAAADVRGILLPVGEAWRAAWRRNPSLPLYADDGFHPSIAGSYLAALVMVGRLYDRSCVGLPASLRTEGGTRVDLSPSVTRVLQEAADEANGRFPGP